MSRPCPRCSGPTRCIDSRYRSDIDHNYRRYECQSKKCGHKFSTAEFIVSDMSKLNKFDPMATKRQIAKSVVKIEKLKEADDLITQLKKTLSEVY